MKALLIFFTLFLSPVAQTAVLTVEVSGVNANKGYLLVSLFDSKSTYLKKPLILKKIKVKNSNEVVAKFKGLSSGEYGISISYDKNSNGKLDTGPFGIPTEPYGFSNNARGSFGPPSFNKVAFKINNKPLIEKINLN